MGYKDLWYIGYSGATSQMLYALATNEAYFRERVWHVSLLAPCTVPAAERPGVLNLWSSGIDIKEIAGPDWGSDFEKACTVVSNYTCIDMEVYEDQQPTSLKTQVHISQMASKKKF